MKKNESDLNQANFKITPRIFLINNVFVGNFNEAQRIDNIYYFSIGNLIVMEFNFDTITQSHKTRLREWLETMTLWKSFDVDRVEKGQPDENRLCKLNGKAI